MKEENFISEIIKISPNYSKWIALVLVEIAIGICSFILPLKIAILLLLLPPVVFILARRFFYAYLIGIFLLPVWSITLTGQPEAPGRADLRFSDAFFFIAALGWLVQGIINKRLDIKRTYLDFVLIALFFWIFLSIIWSPTYLVGVKDFLRKLNGLFIFYLTVNLIKNRKDLNLTMIIFIIAGSGAALLAFHEIITKILQHIGGLSKAAISHWGWLRATALKEGANRLGFFLNICLMITISQFLLMKKTKYRIILLTLIILMTSALIATLSRNSVIGFVIGTTVLIYFMKKGGKKFLLITAVVALLFLLTSGPGYRHVLFERYVGIVQPYETGGYAGRIQIWQVASKIFEEHPILGTGIGGFHAISKSYGAAELESPHNLYIYVTTELGLIGFLLFLTVALRFIVLAKHGLQTPLDEKERSILVALLTGVLIYGFQGLVVNFTLIEREFWAILGLNVAAIKISCEDKIQHRE